MVSDSLRAKHCPPGGNYELGGHPIEIGEDGLARLKGTDTIAGSTLNMNKGLKILVEDAMIPFDAALNSCTINPARALRVDDRRPTAEGLRCYKETPKKEGGFPWWSLAVSRRKS